MEKSSGVMILESLLFGENLLLLVLPPSSIQISPSAFFQRSQGWLKKKKKMSFRSEFGDCCLLARLCSIFTHSSFSLPPRQQTLCMHFYVESVLLVQCYDSKEHRASAHPVRDHQVENRMAEVGRPANLVRFTLQAV